LLCLYLQGAAQVALSDSDKQTATSNLTSKQTSEAVEAVVNSVLSEAFSNVATVHKPAVEMVRFFSGRSQSYGHFIIFIYSTGIVTVFYDVKYV
jgi:hypothetical protein